MSRNVVLVDFNPPDNWKFIDGLKKATEKEWEIKRYISNQARTSLWAKVRRYLLYFAVPFDVFIKRNTFLNIIAWQQFYGLIFAFYCKLFRVKKINHLTILTFIYKEKSGIVGKFYRKFMEFLIDGPYIDEIVSYSSEECEHYKHLFPAQKDKFKYCLFGFEDSKEKFKEIVPESKGYLYSSGRSNRDYMFIIQSIKNTRHRLEIVCDTLPKTIETSLITIHNDLYLNEDYYRLIAESFCLVLSAENETVSSGQLVLLEAFQFGKPVIATQSKGIEDYITNGVNGFLIPKSRDALLEKIELLKNNEEMYHEMSLCARKTYDNKFTEKHLGERIGNLIIR